MRLHRFFVEKEIGAKKEIIVRDANLYHQLKDVFRFTVGGQVILLDNSGFEYKALVSSFDKGNITFAIVSSREAKTLPKKEVVLFCSIPKKDKLEWILEKGTELGVSRFVPVVSERSEKKNFNTERGQKILKEAAEQSGRPIIPTISEPIEFEEALENSLENIAFDPKGDEFTPEHTYNKKSLGIFIGPEGGWTEKELFLFKKHGVKTYSLGEATLRAETAAIAAATLVLLT